MNRRNFCRQSGLTALGLFAMTQLSACAAGNFGLVRRLGGWNRSFSVIPRVLIYIVFVIIPVYELSLLFDFILNNTIEFWSGSPIIQAKNENFERDGMKVQVQHTRQPLRKTVVTVVDQKGAVQSVSELRENDKGLVEVYVNGAKKAELTSIEDGLVQVTSFNKGVSQRPFAVREESFSAEKVRARFKSFT